MSAGGTSGIGGTSAGGTSRAAAEAVDPTRGLDLWEVFVRARRGLSHQHVGSLHAPDAQVALRRARDLYTRRGEGVSIWVVPAGAVSASDPGEKEPYFTPARDKDYRYPTYYELPKEVRGL